MEGNSNLTKIIAIIAALAIVVGGIVLFVNSNDDDDEASETNTTQQEAEDNSGTEVAQLNIVETAISVPDLSTLVTAVDAAGLVETLSDPDANYTVFAPTNAAFDALPEGTLDSLLAQPDLVDLTNILTYHVVDSAVFSSDLRDGQVVPTLNGADLVISITDGVVKINEATVVTPDVTTSNGVVHVIDGVLLP